MKNGQALVRARFKRSVHDCSRSLLVLGCMRLSTVLNIHICSHKAAIGVGTIKMVSRWSSEPWVPYLYFQQSADGMQGPTARFQGRPLRDTLSAETTPQWMSLFLTSAGHMSRNECDVVEGLDSIEATEGRLKFQTRMRTSIVISTLNHQSPSLFDKWAIHPSRLQLWLWSRRAVVNRCCPSSQSLAIQHF